MRHLFKTALLATTICSFAVSAHAADQITVATATPAATPSATPESVTTATTPAVTHHTKKAKKVSADAAPVAAPAVAPSAAPATNDNIVDALMAGHFWGEARYRYEDIHQDNLARQATANTLRTVLGFDTGDFMHFKAQLAALDVLHLSNDTYNDTTNGRTAYPGITDPQDLQLFLANVTYSGLPDTTATFGRQKIAIDNERWVGAANWRQIAQTFDGLVVDNKSIKDLDLMYAFLFHEQRSAGTGGSNGTYDMHTNVFHAAYTGVKNVKLIGYEYLVDLRNHLTGVGVNAGFPTTTTGAAQLSSNTPGFRIEASQPIFDQVALTGNVEYARQFSYANDLRDFAFNYYAIEPGFTAYGLKAKFIYEYMGGDGVDALQTPMMSGHAMNGWADQFQTTPANGLEDAYIDMSYTFKLPCNYLSDTKIATQLHDYNAANISQHYGSEYDIDFVQNIGKNYAVGVQFENYIADHFASDTKKVILTAQVKF